VDIGRTLPGDAADETGQQGEGGRGSMNGFLHTTRRDRLNGDGHSAGTAASGRRRVVAQEIR